MDPIRVSESPDPLPRGRSVFIPFDCYNIQPDGSHDSKLALDLPPMKTIQLARMYLMNNRALAGKRAIDYREFGEDEIKKSLELMYYLTLHRGAL
jgi:hypothetical protein